MGYSGVKPLAINMFISGSIMLANWPLSLFRDWDGRCCKVLYIPNMLSAADCELTDCQPQRERGLSLQLRSYEADKRYSV